MEKKRHGSMARYLVASLVLGGAACVPPGDGELSGRLGVEVAETEESSHLAGLFAEAADEFGIPVDVLKALAYAETALEGAEGEVEFDGQPEPFGLFALSGDNLKRAAELAGLSIEAVITDEAANVRAAAALLSAHADEVGLDPALRPEPGVWGKALQRWSDLDGDEAKIFAKTVLTHLAQGVAVPLPDGTNVVIGRNADMVEGEIGTTELGIGAAGVVWKPSPNYNSRSGSRVELVVIHTCEGAYAGCVSWLRNSRAGVSAHYVVNESGSEVSHLVGEEHRAWHIGASYRSRLNEGRLSHRDGQSSNTFSVGIEHAGRASQSRFPDGQINRSIALVRDITARHNIPRDRYHIVAHGRLQPESRSDPGPNWPWSSYLAAISGGNQMPPPPSNPPPTGQQPPSNPPPSTPAPAIITVDNSTPGRFKASPRWEASSWAAGKIGADYRFRAPQEISDLAEYRIPVAERGRYEIFTRVPGNGYNNRAPFIIHHAGGRTTVTRDLSSAGGTWLSLGTYELPAGDDWIVQLSCWTGGRGWLIADAIRLERR